MVTKAGERLRYAQIQRASCWSRYVKTDREAGGMCALSDKYGLGLSVPSSRHVGKVDVDVDAGDKNVMFRECK